MRSLLIDGYNLLHVTDLFGEGRQAGTLEGAREALLAFLVARLTARERGRTRVVFDAAGAPPGLPKVAHREGMQVLFARDYADADAMLEAFIERARAPKELLVVSGDRRVQRAARMRGAAWVDSADWFRTLRQRGAGERGASDKSTAQEGSVGDVEYWVKEFTQGSAGEPSEGVAGKPKRRTSKEPLPPSESVFPPGYAQDLAEEWERAEPQLDHEGHGDPPGPSGKPS